MTTIRSATPSRSRIVHKGIHTTASHETKPSQK